jgi:hypothetical protein
MMARLMHRKLIQRRLDNIVLDRRLHPVYPQIARMQSHQFGANRKSHDGAKLVETIEEILHECLRPDLPKPI